MASSAETASAETTASTTTAHVPTAAATVLCKCAGGRER
jgi:hypothetical protein